MLDIGNTILIVAKMNFSTGIVFLQGYEVARSEAGPTLGCPLSGKMALSPSLLLKISSETLGLARMRRTPRIRVRRLVWKEKAL